MKPPIFLFLIPFLFSFHAILLTPSMASNTMAMNQTLRDGQTILSPQQTFELGFFSPTITSHNRYLGIWYKRLATGTVAWVANRQTPIANKNGELTLHSDGVLVLRDSATNTIVWSSGTSTTAATPNPFAQLLDSGNLMVVDSEGGIDGPDDYIWQSFDHPGNTFLPGMKFGRNLQKGVITNFTSWKNDDDPSEGDQMVYMDFNGVPQIYKKKGDMIDMRIGSWNGLSFTGMPVLKPDSVFKFEQVFNEKEIYYKFELVKNDNLIKIMLNPDGDFVRLNWNNQSKEWSLFSTPELEDKCTKYMLCGPYASCNTDQFPAYCGCLKGFVPKNPRQWDAGDWTSGCQRKIPLDCGDREWFRPYPSMKLPDTRRSWFDRKMDLEQCRVKCKHECNCSAYSSLDMKVNIGCILWYDELVDIRSFSNIGQDIYIRTEKRKKKLSKKKKAAVIAIPVSVGTVGLGLAALLGLRTLSMIRKLDLKPQGGHDPAEKGKEESQTYESKKENPHDVPLVSDPTILDANNSFSNNNDDEGGNEKENKMRRINRGRGRGRGRGASKAGSNIVGRGDPRVDENDEYDTATFTNEPDQIQQEDDAVVDPSSESELRARCRYCLRKTPRHLSQRPETPTDPPVSHYQNAADTEFKEETYVDLDSSTIPPDDPDLRQRSDEGQPRFGTTSPPGARSSVTSYGAHNEMRHINRGKGRGSGKTSSNIVEHGNPRADETNDYDATTYTNELDQLQQEDDTVVDPSSESESKTTCNNCLRKTQRHPSLKQKTPMDPSVSYYPNEADMELKEETYADLDPSTIPPDDSELRERSDERQPRLATTGPPGASSSVTPYGAHNEKRRVNKGKGRGSIKASSNIVMCGDPRANETNDYDPTTFTNELDQIEQEDDAFVGPSSESESRTIFQNPSQQPETPTDPPVSHYPNAADMELKEDTYVNLDSSTTPPDDPELLEHSDEGHPQFATTDPPEAKSSATLYGAHDEMRRVHRGKGRGSSKTNSSIVEHGDPRADETNDYDAATFTNEQDQIQQEDDAIVGPFSGSELRTKYNNTLRKTPRHPSQRPETTMDPQVYHFPKVADIVLKEDMYVNFGASTIPPDETELWKRSYKGQPRFSTIDPPGAKGSATSYGVEDEKRHVNKGKGRGSIKGSSNIVMCGDPRANETNDYDPTTFTNELDQIEKEDDAFVGPSPESESRTIFQNPSQQPEMPTDPPVSHYPNASDMELKEDTYVNLDSSTIPPDDPELWEHSDEGHPQFATTGPPEAKSSTTLYGSHDEMRRVHRGKGRGSSKTNSSIVEHGDPRADETNDYDAATFTNEQDQIQQEDDTIVGPFSGSELRNKYNNTLRKTPRHPSQRPETTMDPQVYHYPKVADMVLKEDTYVNFDASTIPPDETELWKRSDKGQPRFSTIDPPGAKGSATSYGVDDEKKRVNKGKGRGSIKASSNIVGPSDPHADDTNDFVATTFTNESNPIQLEDDVVVVPSSGLESMTRYNNILRNTPRHPSQGLETSRNPLVYQYPKVVDMALKDETYVHLDLSTIPPDDPELWERSDEGLPGFAKTGHLDASSRVTSYSAHDEVYALKEKLVTYEERLEEEQRKRAELERVQKKQVEELARQKELSIQFEAFMAQYNGRNPPSPPSQS